MKSKEEQLKKLNRKGHVSPPWEPSDGSEVVTFNMIEWLEGEVCDGQRS